MAAANKKQPLIASILVAVVLCFALSVSGAEIGGGGGGDAAADVLAAAAEVGGKSSSMSCIGKLQPCQKFMTDPSAEPSPECCSPMTEVVTKEAACLCALFQNPALLQSVNITHDSALGIAKKCGSDADPSICKSAANSPTASQSDAAASTSTPSSSESGASDAKSEASPSAVYLLHLSFPFLGLIM